MSLITEDGSIVAGAESLCSVAAADTYHSNFGNTAWALLATGTKESMLRRATTYMQQVYRLRWKGSRIGAVQMLDWPRYGVALDDVGAGRMTALVAVNVVPLEVQQACAALALIANTGDLSPAIEREIIRERVVGIDTHYRPGAVQYKRYRAIDNMLKIYLGAAGGDLVRG